ncbi:hypothetical protein [Mesorhizobium sp. L2C089B000]|uniref:hypothetical protein n=1 Tax=Mesorhizobium sp. L2C089B000 TaxID=1287120 RepID=UPI001FD87359|nr:hypothetical protein [Mesorhizobium sp. L2C089B000]
MRRAGKHCQWVRGAPVDEAVSALLLEAMAPAVIDVALAVPQEINHRVERAGRPLAAGRASAGAHQGAGGRFPAHHPIAENKPLISGRRPDMTILYCSADRLCRRGAPSTHPVKPSPEAYRSLEEPSFDSCENGAPSEIP